MKSVLISIRPKWCGKIASGEKTIEVRKTRPKLQTPFRCYIYCTGDTKTQFWIGRRYSYADDHSHNIFDRCGNRKIIGEFVCDRIDRYNDEVVNSSSLEDFCGWNDFDLNRACMHPDDLEKYADGKDLYGWHISDLKIYDTPKELSDYQRMENGTMWSYPVKITRPPQSWMYVEELI